MLKPKKLVKKRTLILLVLTIIILNLIIINATAAMIGHTAPAIYNGTFAGGNFTFQDSMFVNDYVGIGTTSPTSKLEVAGTFNATSSSTQMLLNSNGDIVINLKG